VANVVSAAHVTATAVTAASVATAHRVKKVLQRMTTPHTSKPHKRPVSHVNRVNLALSAKNVASARIVPHVMHLAKKRNKKQHTHPHVPACPAFKPSHCL
jgi:hypothetical protein